MIGGLSQPLPHGARQWLAPAGALFACGCGVLVEVLSGSDGYQTATVVLFALGMLVFLLTDRSALPVSSFESA